MNQETVLCKVAEASGYTLEETQRFYQAFIHILAEAFRQEEEVECLPDWGRFTPKLRDNTGRNENSPRHPRKPHYLIQFRPSKSFENDLCAVNDTHADGETA